MIEYHAAPASSAAGRERLSRFSLLDFEQAGIRVAERRLGSRDIIFAPGDPDGQLYFVLEGTVRLYKIYGGCREATVALLSDGDVFGGLDLGGMRRQDAFAETISASRVAVVRKPNLIEATRRHPAIRLEAALRFLRAPQSVGRDDRKPLEQGGVHAAFHPALAPGRPLRRARRPGQGPQAPSHAPGTGEHGRLHQRGRLQGNERVPARRPDRGSGTQDLRLPAIGRDTLRQPALDPGGGVRTPGHRGGEA